MNKSIKFWIIASIMILAALFRLWKLNSIPPSLTPDEAALGYNAYSILKTGKDEYGELMPVIFKSFGDYKPGLYIYSAVPFIAVFGLNEWSVRLPSAIAGIFSVYLIYLIVGLAGKLLKFNSNLKYFALFTSAVNPWLIYQSRGAWEANLSLSFTLAGIYYFLKFLQKQKYLFLCTIFFSLTLLTYQGAKLSTSIVVISLLIPFWQEIKTKLLTKPRNLILAVIIALLIVFPILLSFFQGKTGRLEVFSVFSYPRPREYLLNMLGEGREKIGDLNYYLFHSEGFNFVRGISGRWFNHFSGKFLFFEGDYQNPKHSSPNHGMLLLIDMLLLTSGLVYFLRKNTLNNKYRLFVLIWLFFSPLPAILTRDQVQSVRSFNMVIPLMLITSAGLWFLTDLLRKYPLRYLGIPILIIVNAVSLLNFIDSYFIHLPVHNAKYWNYGYKDAVLYISPVQNNYENIIFQQSYSQPYIYFLFYQKYDPVKYQSQASLKSGGVDVGLVEKLDNISFVNYSWPPGSDNQNTMVVGNSVAVPPDFSGNDFKLLKEIKYPDNISVSFRILERNQNGR